MAGGSIFGEIIAGSGTPDPTLEHCEKRPAQAFRGQVCAQPAESAMPVGVGG